MHSWWDGIHFEERKYTLSRTWTCCMVRKMLSEVSAPSNKMASWQILWRRSFQVAYLAGLSSSVTFVLALQVLPSRLKTKCVFWDSFSFFHWYRYCFVFYYYYYYYYFLMTLTHPPEVGCVQSHTVTVNEDRRSLWDSNSQDNKTTHLQSVESSPPPAPLYTRLKCGCVFFPED